MAGLLICLLILFLIFYVFTRQTWVRIIKEDDLKIEIHLPILAIQVINRQNDGDNKKNSGEDQKLSYRAYLRIISAVLERSKNYEVVIKKITLPYSSDRVDKSIVGALRKHALICAVIAYLRTKSQKLFLEDNAITLSPDITKTHFYVTAKARLYEVIYALLTLRRGIYEEKKRAKDM